MKRTNEKRNNKGFSLVELIIVIAIMAVLVGILAPQFLGYVKKSKASTDIKNAQEIASTIAVQIANEEGKDVAVSSAKYPIPATADKEVYKQVSTISEDINLTVGSPKADSAYEFVYKIKTDGTVEVAVAKVSGNSISNAITLFPAVDADAATNTAWKQ